MGLDASGLAQMVGTDCVEMNAQSIIDDIQLQLRSYAGFVVLQVTLHMYAVWQT